MTETWIVCPKEVKAPYSIEVQYKEKPASFVPLLFPRSSQPSGMPLVLYGDKGFTMKIQTPSLPAWGGILVIVYGNEKVGPEVEKIDIERN
jgi:hypothetical protein